MLELIYINELLTLNGVQYSVSNLEATSDLNVMLCIYNDVHLSFVVFAANETMINGVVQTSAQMIIDTLTTV